MGAGLACLTAGAASAAVLWWCAQDALKHEVRSSLMRTASTAAQLVDVPLHETLTDPSQEASPEYERAVDPLRRVLRGDGQLAFVYTAIQKNGQVRFVLDPTPAGDGDGDGVDDKSHVMEAYADADEALLRALRTGEPQSTDVPYTDAWGTFLSGYAPLRRADGSLAGVLGVDLDATRYAERLGMMRRSFALGLLAAVGVSALAAALAWRMRRNAMVAGERLHRMLDEVVAARIEAQRTAQAKSDFLATMSHEIRTPLGGIIGIGDLLAGDDLTAGQREHVRLMRGSAASLLAMVDEILQVSKLDACRVELESIPLSPATVARDVVALLQSAAKPGVALRCVVEDGVPSEIEGDPGKLRQILTNLTGNALKFTERGEVVVRVGARGGADAALVIEVRDTGIGIPEHAQARIFAPYEQVDSSTARRFGGTGLGLAISKRLVELMGGSVALASAAGQGTTFTVTIPLGRAEAPGPAQSSVPRSMTLATVK